MTSLLLHWLNEELVLHRKVNVLERDLCNGYILAEILHVHGLENHLERYTDELDLSTRVTNLELLDKAMIAGGLGELGLHTKRQVMMEDRSSISQLLLRMKEFIESKRAKISIEQQRLQSIPSKVYEPRSPLKDPTRTVQDVEERFIKETAKQYHPTEVRFYKDVNSAIHLRKFPQTQWQTENELIQWEEATKADRAKQSANGMAALRARMNEKRTFMKDWDQKRLAKWQQTQERYLDAERDDLRLELTLEERRRRFHAAKLAETQADAKNGVAGFERNMSRLGLGNAGGATEPKLRAIPASDPGAIAHLERLEERVKELGFRPSNNIQMMKELRARRSAQLAAEKDRRLRRMKAASDANRLTVATSEESPTGIGSSQSTPVEDIQSSDEPSRSSPLSIQDAFIDANRQALEDNYSRLRELGVAKREVDADELQRLRFQKRSKMYERHKRDCGELVDDLISLVVAIVGHQEENGIEKLTASSQHKWPHQTRKAPNGADVRPREGDDQNEIEILTQTYIGLSNSWESYAVAESTPIESMALSIRGKVESFVRTACGTPSSDSLETKWTKLERSKFVVMFSSDERGHKCVRDVAFDHSLHYINVDELFEECVKNSYDPVKQVDLAATLGKRERELGVFGPKISALRQKNTPIPESMAVEVVLAVIALGKPPEESAVENDTQATNALPNALPNDFVGFLLHNFPRSIDEWKLFEKAILNSVPPVLPDDVKTERFAAIESALAATPGQLFSCISCAVAISFWDPLSRTPTPTTPGLTPSSSSSEISQSAGERRRQTEVSKRQLVVDPAIAKAEAEQEMLQRRRQVEEVLAKSSHLIKVDQEEMHESVLQELLHLVIDVYSAEALGAPVGTVVECGTNLALPDELEVARENRRRNMTIEQRVAWMVASKQLQLNDQMLFDVVMRLDRLENALSCNLRKLFEDAFESLEGATTRCHKVQETLDDILGTTASNCQTALEKTSLELPTHTARSDKLLIATEVALGDTVDAQRLVANQFVDEQAKDSQRALQDHLLSWIQHLPLVCLELKEFVVDTVEALRSVFYAQFGFLRSTSDNVLPVDVSSSTMNALVDAVETLDECCQLNGLQISLAPELLRLASQLGSTPVEDCFVNSCRGGYEMEETTIAKALANAALQRMAAILRWSTQLVDTFKSLHSSQVDAMRKYIQRDLRHSNRAITQVMQQLSLRGSASWPETWRRDSLPPQRLTRHQRSTCLSARQVGHLIDAFASVQASNIGVQRQSDLVSCDAFASTVVEVARREGFPDVWQDATSVARVAIAWSSDQEGKVPWRRVVFALICAQAVGFPTTEALESLTDQLYNLSMASEATAHGGGDPRVIRADLLTRTTMWFDDGSSLPGQATTQWKNVIATLFLTNSTRDHVDVFLMLFTMCAAPPNPRKVHAELASTLLPRYSRGLHRALVVLSRWSSASASGSVGTPRVDVTQLRPLLAFANVEVDDARLRNASGGDDSHAWRRQDAVSFLTWCEAYDPAIARSFSVRDTFAALLDD